MMSASAPSKRWLAAIVLLGAALRFFPIWFGLPYPYARPDEAEAVSHAVGVLKGDLNPHFFHWPSLTFYLFAAAFWLVSAVRTALADAPELTRDAAVLTGRAVVAAAGTLTLIPVWSIGRRLAGEAGGLAAAFLLAVAPLHVRDSHFAMTDVLMTFFSAWCLARLLRANEDALAAGSPNATPLRGFLVAGVLGGLAASTKYNAGVLAAAMAAAQLVLAVRRGREARSLRVWAPLALSAVGGIAGFLAGTPYAVLDSPAFMTDFLYDLTHLSEGHGIAGERGWVAHAVRSLPYGCGMLVFAAACAGLALAPVRAWRPAVVLIAFAAAFYAILGSGYTVFFRYVMPLVPVLCVFAAVTVIVVAERLSRSGRVGFTTAAAVIVGLVAAPSLVNSAWMDVLLSRRDTRVVAAQWLRGRLLPEHSLHDAGGAYVRLDLHGQAYHQWFFDQGTRSFGDPEGRTPDWIVVPESPLRVYVPPNPAIQQLVSEHYNKVFTVKGTGELDSRAVYDQQDAFFMPFTRLWEVERPGPTISIYRRSR